MTNNAMRQPEVKIPGVVVRMGVTQDGRTVLYFHRFGYWVMPPYIRLSYRKKHITFTYTNVRKRTFNFNWRFVDGESPVSAIRKCVQKAADDGMLFTTAIRRSWFAANRYQRKSYRDKGVGISLVIPDVLIPYTDSPTRNAFIGYTTTPEGEELLIQKANTQYEHYVKLFKQHFRLDVVDAVKITPTLNEELNND